MKVLALVILALGSAAARGSGPYLPSGWRPDGPAFFLPAEQKPAENPLKDVILQGSEASGSEALREYGPPKVAELSQDLIKQSLPDVAIEQDFNEIKQEQENYEIKQDVTAAAVEESVNLNEAAVVASVEEAVTESQEQATTLEAVVPIIIVEPTSEVQSVTELEVTDNVEASTSSNVHDSDGSANSIQSISQEFIVNSETESPVTEASFPIIEVDSAQKFEQVIEAEVQKLEQVVAEVQEVEQEVKSVEQSAQNIPDALAYLENGIQQVELAQAQVDAAILENSG
ncbi:uncharacterized protein LOC123703659 [Colias croceus]|uniref:uncharacterized protein LOC123703659 n=1 Tax=Colias crocea TaxID=72248 RepID=UPI001E27A857|nr:uncharacterized protein LOC123703659 [Colias croceus]